MVRFERTLTIRLETSEERDLYLEALEVAADNAPTYDAPGSTREPTIAIELKTRRAVLSCTPPSVAVPARITLSYEAAGYLATALEVLEETAEETRAETAGQVEITAARAALLKRCNMLENAARYIREAARS